MILSGFCRLGKDAELRYTSGDNSTAVTNLALAFNYGRRDGDGNRPTQWVDAALFGPRAESLVEYLLKGQGLDVVIEDVHIETYDGNNGTGYKLVGRVVMIDFAGSNPNTQGGGQQQQRGNGGGNGEQRTQQQGTQQRGNGGTQQRTQGNGNARGQQQGQQRGQQGSGRNSSTTQRTVAASAGMPLTIASRSHE